MDTPKPTTELAKFRDIELPTTWGTPSATALKAMNLSAGIAGTKHGLMSSIPIVCSGSKCRYKQTCLPFVSNCAPVGERCPVEQISILTKYEAYRKDLNIDENRIIEISLLKELIDCDVMIDRCNQILATANLIEDVVSVVSVSGDVYTRPEVNKAIEIKEKSQKRKEAVLQLLNSTPKDKAKTEAGAQKDPSMYAATIVKQFLESQKKAETIEGEYSVVNDESAG